MHNAVIHSVRHSFRDRLRNAVIQSEMIDQPGDRSTKNVVQEYGDGFALPILNNQTLRLKNRSINFYQIYRFTSTSNFVPMYSFRSF